MRRTQRCRADAAGWGRGLAWRGGLCGLAWVGLASLPLGCQVAEPYLLPARTIEMLGTLQPDLRPDAQLPAVRERDRAPTLVRRRALGLTEAELAQATAKKSRYYRVRASEKPPMYYAGGVLLGMGLPPLVIGLMTGLDPVGSAAPTRAITDVAGGGVMLGLAGLHIGVGGLLLALGDRRPQVEPADRGLVQQYVDGTAPLLITGPPLQKDPEPTAEGTPEGTGEASGSPPGSAPAPGSTPSP